MLKFQCLNNGFHFLEFKLNWFNNDDSLNMELFYNDDLHLIRKGNESLAKEIINYNYHSKYTVAYSKLSIGTLLLFHLITQIFHLCFLEAPLLIFYSTRSFLITLIFQLKSLFTSLLFNHFLLPLGTASTQNSCFSPSAHKPSVASAPVKNI